MPGLPIARPVVFPLHAITEGECACGTDGCTRIGKHAAVNWGDVAWGSEVPRPEPGAGSALRTGAHPLGSDVFVVDLDGDAAAELFDAMGPCPETFTVSTPRGWHLYFSHPGFAVKTSAGDLGPGIDVRGEGGIIIAPGSPHRSGGSYDVDVDAPLAPAPEWLLAWLREQKAPTESQVYPGDVTDPVELNRRKGLYTAFLRDEATPRGPERRGQGDALLFGVVQRGAYDLALPVVDVLELVREHYDARCSPPWGAELDERVHHKARDAKENSTRQRMEPLPADLAHLAGGGPVPVPIPSDASIDDIEKSLKISWDGWDRPLPPAVYLIAPIVPEKTIGLLVAKGSSLKTWLVVSMLASVARGTAWLDTFPVTQCLVLFVDFESGRDTIQERMQYLRIATTRGMGIASFPRARLDDPSFWIRLAKVVLARGVRLVGIDSFAAGATGVDENDAKSADPLHYCTLFIEETGCSVVFIHHAKKGEGGDERDLVRGSGAIFGAADWVYTMLPQDEDRTRMVVRNIKPYRKKTEDFCVALTVDGLVLDVKARREEQDKSETIRAQIKSALMGGPIADIHLLDRAIGKKNGTASPELAALVLAREVVFLPSRGYDLDNPEARTERIRKACQVPGLTPSGLATAACVTLEEIHSLMAENRLAKSGSRWTLK